jgi:hypothetical protein
MDDSADRKGRVLLPLMFHLHQPVGNFPGTFAHAYRRSYEPLVNSLVGSGLKFNLHISGALLDWLVSNRPPFIDRLRSLCAQGRLEVLGGGYYEPILPMIPSSDRRRQLGRLADRVEGLFGCRPRGAWLAERVWEPELAADLSRAGYRYTLLDDRHFLDLGWRREDVHAPFSTEQDGEVLAVFPIDEPIRYLIPWEAPRKTLAYLEGCRPLTSRRGSVVVLMSDAEKMGLWPARRGTTYDLCYREGWMDRFLRGIAAASWIEPLLLSEVLDGEPPRRLVYLPTASYDRMAVWALPTEARRRLEALPGLLERSGLSPELRGEVERFVGGTHWRNFLVKYPAADRLHKAYLYVRDRLLAAERTLEPAEVDRLWDRLDSAAVNDVYWHGLFGGVYYHFLRHHCYRRLAEVLARLDRGGPRRVFGYDYERLGGSGAVMSDSRQTVVLDHAGAALDWISKEPPAGLAGGFTRIAEPYHRGDERGLVVDRSRRGFCRLLLYPGRAGGDRVLGGGGECRVVELSGPRIRGDEALYTGEVVLRGRSLGIDCRYGFHGDGWGLEATVVNRGPERFGFTLGLDVSPSPPGGPRDLTLSARADDRRIPLSPARRDCLGDVDSWRLTDGNLGVTVTGEASPRARLFVAPVRTVEGTEAGLKRSWQGLQLVCCWFLRLEPGDGRSVTSRFEHSTGTERC